MTIETAEPETKTLYFGYGSNLWIDQMNRRCPENKLVGLGVLQGWKWIINDRGYANIIRSPEDLVYGLVYEISKTDEANLDRYEHVPVAYIKETMDIKLQSADKDEEKSAAQALVYVDEERVEESKPKEEYIYRMNRGIDDAAERGLPSSYIDKYIRKFIPAEGKKEVV